MKGLLASSLSLAVVMAAQASWKSKPVAQWSEEDARVILSTSPWAKEVKAIITRRLTEEQLREGGQMGQPRGVGYDNVDRPGSGPKVSPNILAGPGGDDRSERSRNQPLTLRLRWESALPVRLAELKSHEIEPPTMEGDGYRLAVYGIPVSDLKGDPRQSGLPLKNLASLKREGRKDVKPISVEVFQSDRGMIVVYLFPLSAEISPRDQVVQFDAQIGRIVISQQFVLSEMEFAGKLEL